MKRKLSLLVLALAVMACLAGCADDKMPAVTPTPSPAASEGPAARAGDVARGIGNGMEDLARGVGDAAQDVTDGAANALR